MSLWMMLAPGWAVCSLTKGVPPPKARYVFTSVLCADWMPAST